MQYVSCCLMGGLGNQLFQIFAVIAYAKKHKCSFVFKYSKQPDSFGLSICLDAST